MECFHCAHIEGLGILLTGQGSHSRSLILSTSSSWKLASDFKDVNVLFQPLFILNNYSTFIIYSDQKLIMNERITTSMIHLASSTVCAKFFDGAQWTQCNYEHLRNDIQEASDLFLKLARDGGELIGFCISPCLALPALILSATLSSCPFVFLSTDAERLSSTLLHKLGLRWVLVEGPLNDDRFKVSETLEIRSTLFVVYEYLDVSENVNTTENEKYLYATTTSGSTGVPKVVRVPEESILPNVIDFSSKLGLNSTHGILLSTALTFDPAILEFFLAVINGSPLIMVSKGISRNPALLLLGIQEGGAAFYQTTPSLFRLWNEQQKRDLLGHESNLKFLVLGGEKFPSFEEMKKWEPSTNVRIYNTYGVTEVSCWATLNLAFPNDNWKNFSDHGPDIGECLSNTLIKSTQESPTGLHHLMIGSSTRVCAIENETFKELRTTTPVFRSTGDLFEVVDKKYYFCRRMDSIVKRLGKKINVSLIEQKCHEIGLDSAASVRSSGNGDQVRLLLFVVGERDSKAVLEGLESLKKILPGDHWPDEIDFLNSLPLSPHGKLDRITLESYAPSKPECSYFTFVEFWNFFTSGFKRSELINKDKGFVASGGNSFTAILFINSLKDVGFPDNSNLLVALLKDESLGKCWASYPELLRIHRKRKRNNDKNKPERTNEAFVQVCTSSTTEVEDITKPPHSYILHLHLPEKSPIELPKTKVTAKLDSSCSDSLVESKLFIPHNDISMALKGHVWPQNPLPVDPVWSSQCRSIQYGWSVDLLKCVDASPLAIVSSNSDLSFLIVGSHSGLVVVLKCDSGDIISHIQLPDRVEASACLSSDHSSYCIGCYDGNIYQICCTDSKIVWSFQTQDLVKSTCVLHLEKLFVGSYDKYVYALSEGGALLWKQLVGPVTIPVLPFQSSIIVGTLSSTIWRLSTDDGSVLSKTEISSPLFSNLAITTHPSHQCCVLVSPVEGPIQWRNINTLNEVDQVTIRGQKFASPVFLNDGSTIITSDKTIHHLQFLTTTWSYEFQNRIVSTPFVVGSRIVAITIDGALHILDNRGVLLCTYSLPGEVFSSPVIVGSRVFVGCRDNNFYCLNVSA